MVGLPGSRRQNKMIGRSSRSIHFPYHHKIIFLFFIKIKSSLSMIMGDMRHIVPVAIIRMTGDTQYQHSFRCRGSIRAGLRVTAPLCG